MVPSSLHTTDVDSGLSHAVCNSVCSASEETQGLRNEAVEPQQALPEERSDSSFECVKSPRLSRDSTLSPNSSVSSPSTKSPRIAPLDTPPSSTTDKFGNQERHAINSVPGSRIGKYCASFSSRRRAKPASLDVDALRRERQFTGPYSSNPLLSHTRTDEDNSADKLAVEQLEGGASKPEERFAGLSSPSFGRSGMDDFCSPHKLDPSSTKRIRLPRIMSGHFAALSSYALPSTTRALPSSAVTPTYLLTDPLAATPTGDRMRASSHPASVAGNSADPPRNNEFADPTGKKTNQNTEITSQASTMDEKRMRFLELCGEIWDLVKDRG